MRLNRLYHVTLSPVLEQQTRQANCTGKSLANQILVLLLEQYSPRWFAMHAYYEHAFDVCEHAIN